MCFSTVQIWIGFKKSAELYLGFGSISLEEGYESTITTQLLQENELAGTAGRGSRCAAPSLGDGQKGRSRFEDGVYPHWTKAHRERLGYLYAPRRFTYAGRGNRSHGQRRETLCTHKGSH